MTEMPLSNVVTDISDAVSIRFNQITYDLKRAGHDPIVLSSGEAYFDIPLFDFGPTDIEKGFHYSDSQGLPELRSQIADLYTHNYKAKVTSDEILVTAGSKFAIYASMLAVLNPGDEVLVHEPCWLSYPHQARLAGGVPKAIPYDVEPSGFSKFFTSRTRLLILNNPNNPAGRLYSAEELQLLYKECRKRSIYLLVDEAYSDFVLDQPFTSMAQIAPDKDGVIVVNSLSKNMGMSGWRIGYAIGHPRFIQALLKVNQHAITCAPTILLRYVSTYFNKILEITLPQVRAVVEKRRRIAKMMDELGLKRMKGDTTFYFLVSIENFPGTSTDLAMHLLLRKMIAVVPGSAYGDSTDRFIRVGIGAEPDERIWESLQVIKSMITAKELPYLDYEGTLERLVPPRP